MDDRTLFAQLADPKTQRSAFEYMVRQHSERLYWIIRRIVISHEDANDLLQNTFLKAWSSLDKFKGESKVNSWLSSIAINESLDFLRRNKHMTFASTDEDMAVANNLMADPYFDGSRTEALLQQAIATLPEVQRLVFQMRYFDDMKYSEISRLLGTSEGALKASYHHAVNKIAEFFHTHD